MGCSWRRFGCGTRHRRELAQWCRQRCIRRRGLRASPTAEPFYRQRGFSSRVAIRECKAINFEAFEAHTTQQAIDHLQKDEHVDVVFSDVQMPGMDGFELQRWTRQHRPRVKVLLASGGENVKAASAHMGSPRWLVFKPYSMADLEQRISSCATSSATDPERPISSFTPTSRKGGGRRLLSASSTPLLPRKRPAKCKTGFRRLRHGPNFVIATVG